MREVWELFDVDWYDCEKSELVELAKFLIVCDMIHMKDLLQVNHYLRYIQ